MNVKSLAHSIFALFLLAFSSTSVQAHPHNWIDLKSRFILDDEGRLTQVKQRWEFDDYFSMMTLADIVTEHGSEEEGLPKMADQMIENLSKYGYFSVLAFEGQKLTLNKPQEYQLIAHKKDGQPILELQMLFDVEDSFPIRNKTISWQVYDPTYFIAMNHTKDDSIEFIGGKATKCASDIKQPEPSDDLTAYALSLDRTQKETDGLGEKFAETVFIHCS
ncbi:DUF1007 family protein [Veronia nyctiphanis]|nr:DUF1007 family protein [Veronia nyctiphanis]